MLSVDRKLGIVVTTGGVGFCVWAVLAFACAVKAESVENNHGSWCVRT